MIDVTVVLVEGGMPSTAVAPVEVFSMAGVLWNTMRGEPVEPHFRVRTASQDGQRVSTAVSLNLEPSFAIADVESTDLIIVSAVGADLESACPANTALYPWLRKWHEHGVTIAGVCAGVALLAEAGILDDRPATTHWGVVDTCRRRYPRVHWQPERFLTESDNVLCSGGVYASVDISLYLVEKLCGHRIAMETAKALLLETPRVWQAGYAAEPPEVSHEDSQIRRVQEWLFHNFNEPVRIDALAGRVGMSPRNFARRFKVATGETPTGYLHRLRINAARHLLENEQQTIQQVSRAVGYDDLAFFRRVFKRYVGSPPQRYRKRFEIRPPENVAIAGRAPHR
ncbi:Transcriptional regulator GlxA family, contains an amidase domain and an AraC-type DNA-binding HTH domain [Modicisalibacter ilicicola DSM 19980]|uniref:Transcriptional regulator GlxA family, contains an amidase domain and an AraC-type DNA-binding HTH domain n=1 Tax=Modicisalibacter ilicicola DSM 19980 TaxID=1121942 RepID=A0A1M5BY97_9GAMM|nr:helix-turn-helix domain-containing protein [Halomonas ilicicola]SHF47504.1 Transcriptional regulator GlxA family, contains an amidase domain and an AraC-type DNA-binding HTH domain [Halomonas ilicicola DSM 19980]